MMAFWLYVGYGVLFMCCLLLLINIGIHLYGNDFPRRRRFCQSKAKLHGKTVLVTGCNVGIGYETAKEFARRGARLIMGCRNLHKANKARQQIIDETGNTNIVVIHLDLGDLNSVRKFAKQVIETESKLHILVNNAGISGAFNPKTEEGVDTVFATNHVGPFLLTRLLTDLLKASRPSQIVTVSSMAYRTVKKLDFTEKDSQGNLYPGLKDYPLSKLANVLHVRELNRRLKGTGVAVYVLHPGFVKTNIFHGVEELYGRMARIMVWIAYRTSSIDPWTGAQCTLHCALEESLETVSGRYYNNCREEPLHGPFATSENAAKTMWDVSCKMAGIENK